MQVWVPRYVGKVRYAADAVMCSFGRLSFARLCNGLECRCLLYVVQVGTGCFDQSRCPMDWGLFVVLVKWMHVMGSKQNNLPCVKGSWRDSKHN
jgi:hypothetical protein